MSVSNTHPEYNDLALIWDMCDRALKGEPAIKEAGKKLLPATSGMENSWGEGGERDYECYKSRARFNDTPTESLEGVMGVMFADDPKGDMDEVVTSSGGTTRTLIKSIARACYSKGRHILVIEAPEEGGDPYIAEYPAECLINWKTDGNGNLVLAVFKEMVAAEDDDEFSHETEEQYRVYTPDGVRLYDKNEDLKDEFPSLIAGVVPIVVIGSTDCNPSCDKPPVFRIVECMIAAYRNSADYQQGLHTFAHPTPWAGGMSPEQFEVNSKAGMGAGAAWYLGDDANGSVGYLEFQGKEISQLKESQDSELAQAAEYSVKLTHVSGVESADAKELRDKAQKSTLAIMAESIDAGINKALELLSTASGSSRNFEPVEIMLQGSQTAEATMITALGNQINMGNMPERVMYDYAVKSRMFKGSLEEWKDTMMTGE